MLVLRCERQRASFIRQRSCATCDIVRIGRAQALLSRRSALPRHSKNRTAIANCADPSQQAAHRSVAEGRAHSNSNANLNATANTMAAALPLVKLGFLLVRTVAKPIAGRLKDFLKDHDRARGAFSRLGQMLHKVEVRVAGNEQFLKVDKKGMNGILQAKVKPLDEGKAISSGADFFAESVIFLIAGICLTVEVRSSNKKDEQKKAALEKRFFDAEESIRQHKIQIESLMTELQRARQHVIAMHRDAVGLMQVEI